MSLPKTIARQDTQELWAITCYFNPIGYRRKLANYRLFRHRLSVPPGDRRPMKSVSRQSVPFCIGSDMAAAKCLGTWSERAGCATGHVWAAPRELLEGHHLSFIIGGGAIVRAAYGCLDDMIRLNNMDGRQSAHYHT